MRNFIYTKKSPTKVKILIEKWNGIKFMAQCSSNRKHVTFWVKWEKKRKNICSKPEERIETEGPLTHGQTYVTLINCLLQFYTAIQYPGGSHWLYPFSSESQSRKEPSSKRKKFCKEHLHIFDATIDHQCYDLNDGLYVELHDCSQ